MTVTPLQGITYTCFGLSYILALGFEIARLRWPRAGLRSLGLILGAIGLLTHTAYLALHHPSPAAPYGSLLLLAWVLAVFYFYGTIHHARQAWAVFVLPVVIGLVGLSLLLITGDTANDIHVPPWLFGDTLWGAIHGFLLLFAAVGVSIAFLGSVMYLVQARRLRNKLNPLGGIKILSLERLEAMNRRSVNLAFPLLTAGLVLGGILLKREHDTIENWWSLKVLGTIGLWSVSALLLYMRYAANVAGRRLAILSILAFVLLVAVLATAHPFAEVAK